MTNALKVFISSTFSAIMSCTLIQVFLYKNIIEFEQLNRCLNFYFLVYFVCYCFIFAPFIYIYRHKTDVNLKQYAFANVILILFFTFTQIINFKSVESFAKMRDKCIKNKLKNCKSNHLVIVSSKMICFLASVYISITFVMFIFKINLF